MLSTGTLELEAVKHAAAGAFDLVLEAIGFGGSPDATDGAGRSVLWHAAEQANEQAIRALIRAGANVNACDHRGYTPLMLAARSREPDALRALLDGGAIADVETKEGTTALLAACVWGRDRSVNLLLDRTRPVSGVDGRCSPLHAAVLACSPATVETLMDAGANPNARDASGDSPLLRVVALGRERAAVVRALVEYGADPRVRASSGQTPFEIATARGHHESAAMLSTASAATARVRDVGDPSVRVARGTEESAS